MLPIWTAFYRKTGHLGAGCMSEMARSAERRVNDRNQVPGAYGGRGVTEEGEWFCVGMGCTAPGDSEER